MWDAWMTKVAPYDAVAWAAGIALFLFGRYKVQQIEAKELEQERLKRKGDVKK
jgi:hypothetical protein